MTKTQSVKRAKAQVRLLPFMLRLRVPLGLATMSFALLGLLANGAGVDHLLRPLGEQAATHPATAFGLFSVGFLACGAHRFRLRATWRYAISLVVIGICVMRLMQGELGQSPANPLIDIFGPIGVFSGRFSPESAIAIGALATAVVLRSTLARWGILFLLVGVETVFNRLLEISYNLSFFSGEVGVFSLLGLIAATGSLVSVYIHRPFVRVLFVSGSIGRQTRIFALAAIAVPWGCGYALYRLKPVAPDAVPYEAAIVSIVIWAMLLMIIVTSIQHEKTDLALRRAQSDVKSWIGSAGQAQILQRSQMTRRMDAAWSVFHGTNGQTGVLLLDLDFFERLNQTFGKSGTGDVFTRIVETIAPALRGGDAITKWNADEILILLSIKDAGDLDRVVERLTDALADPESALSGDLDLESTAFTAFFGKSDLQQGDDSPADMILRADADLHRIKAESGHGMVTRYDGDDIWLDDGAQTPLEFMDQDQEEARKPKSDGMAA